MESQATFQAKTLANRFSIELDPCLPVCHCCGLLCQDNVPVGVSAPPPSFGFRAFRSLPQFDVPVEVMVYV